ncbi:MAG: AAA family ATPase [Clostridiales bacterium]|nr:AAA family ATPase [Clostridiales bacterium]
MEIQELLIGKYGKFSDYRMTFRPGVNIIYGGNETGKTTIHSYIKAMLFGLNRGRGRAARMDEYQIRQPWDSPGAFYGSMRIMEDGEIYRIDRRFERGGKPLGLVCETRNLESEHPQEDLETLLGGMSETAFINSVFIPQLHCETDEALAQELRRYMLNSDSSMDGEIDVTRALQSLRKKKKQLEQQQKKEEEELEKKIAQKQEKADALHRELDFLQQQATYYSGEMIDRQESPAARGRDGEAQREEESDRSVSPWMRRLLCAMMVIAGALTMGGAFLTEGATLRIFLGVMTALFWVMAFGVHFLFASEAGERSDGDMSAADKDYSGTGYHAEDRPGCPPELQKDIKSRRESLRKLEEELEKLYQQHAAWQSGNSVASSGSYHSGMNAAAEVPDLQMEIRALTLAIDRICEISDRIYQANGGRLNEIASEILEQITCGRYNRIVMDDAAEVRIHTPSRVLGLSQVSSGTMQQIYFALRMAAGEMFMENTSNPHRTSLPVLLDETFAMYDDRRLEETLRWLKKSGRQVILFTCQSREREILKKL